MKKGAERRRGEGEDRNCKKKTKKGILKKRK